MYEFSHATGWKKIDDFLDPDIADFREALVEAGFESLIGEVGDVEFGVISIALYSVGPGKKRSRSGHEYLADVSLGGTGQIVVLQELPDVIEFMAKVAPPSALADLWFIKHEEQKEKP